MHPSRRHLFVFYFLLDGIPSVPYSGLAEGQTKSMFVITPLHRRAFFQDFEATQFDLKYSSQLTLLSEQHVCYLMRHPTSINTNSHSRLVIEPTRGIIFTKGIY